MSLNGSGVRDTVRVLGVGINTVICELKKIRHKLYEVNTVYLKEKQDNNATIQVDIIKVE